MDIVPAKFSKSVCAKSEGHIQWETWIFVQNVIYFTYFSLDQSGCSLLVCLSGLTNHKMLQSLETSMQQKDELKKSKLW